MKSLVFTVLTLLSVNTWAYQRPNLSKQNEISAKILQVENLNAQTDITPLLANAKNVAAIEVSKTQSYVGLVLEDASQGRSVYVDFKSKDSAPYLKNVIENGSPYIFLYDAQSVKAPTQNPQNWKNIDADKMFVFDPTSNRLLTLGQLIGPMRSIEDQPSFTYRTWLRMHGKEPLNYNL